jgi:16S rRNA (adenine1518-N6/adenine1519-N6)-dimethyltransferase
MAEGRRVKLVKNSTSATPAPRPGAKPKLGQNFLTDVGTAQRIVDALGDISQSRVLEIGPGRGILTGVLASRAGHLIAIELDRVLTAQLRMKYSSSPNVEVLEADILKVDLASLLGPKPGMSLSGTSRIPAERTRVIGNLPYYITSDILLRLFEFHPYFDGIVIMVQQEVADRIAAKPGTRDYGLLSATSQFYAKVEKLFTVPPDAFNPPPKVYSSVLRLTVDPQAEKLGIAPDAFIDFLKLSFGQKRKTLVNNLKERYDLKQVKAALQAAKLRPDVRAEAVPLDKAAAVFRFLSENAL